MKRLLLIMAALALVSASYADKRSDDALNDIRFDPPLGSRIPLDLTFMDEEGAPVRLGDLPNGKPMILVPVYYECPMLCTLSLNGLLRAARALRLIAGPDYTVVAVSINPKDTPQLSKAKRENYSKGYSRGTRDGWRFLTGDAAAIRTLTQAIGFQFVYDETSGQYGHASAIAVISPAGVITRGLTGPEFEPKDMKLALIEASEGKIGTPVERALMYCYSFDGSTGAYTLEIMKIVRLAGAATAIALFVIIGLQIRRERRRRPADAGGPL